MFVPFSGGGVDKYQISNSLRFRSATSAYLSRTPSVSGDPAKWTISLWTKRGILGTNQSLFGAGTLTAGTGIRFLASPENAIDVYRYNGSAFNYRLTSVGVFRDPSAWMHIVVAFDSANAVSAERLKVYINGPQITSFSTANYPTTSYVEMNGSGYAHNFGKSYSNTEYLDGNQANIYLIDGQALSATDFGEYDVNGVWVPKKYTGTYGTNGFYLPFNDGTNLTTLGEDRSGNGNNWTLNNISLTAGQNYDWMLDTPSNNFAVFNAIDNSARALSNGNLTSVATSTLTASTTTIEVSSGKWYVELTDGSSSTAESFGVSQIGRASLQLGSGSRDYVYLGSGSKQNNGVVTAYGAGIAIGDVVGIALDLDVGEITFYKNGVSQGVAFTGLTGNFCPAFGSTSSSGSTGANFNAGQQPFAYSPPTGFKALCTANLPEVTGAALNPRKHFDTLLHAGNGTTQSIIGADFDPDLVWVKCRNNATPSHVLVDRIRGDGTGLYSNATSAEAFAVGYPFLATNGFDVGAASWVNGSGWTFVDWLWKAGGAPVVNTDGSITSQVSANPAAGFSIVSYTGSGANATIGHGLGTAPKLVITKGRGAADSWFVYHANLISPLYYLVLNSTSAQTNNATIWNTTAPTSGTFSVGTNTDINGSGKTYIAYCFSEIQGYSKIGSYVGNGSANGPFVYCGFRPKFVLIKRTDAVTGANWCMKDALRASPYNPQDGNLYANVNNLEDVTNTLYIDFLSNGFKLRGTYAGSNVNGGTYVFYAVAEHPFGGSNVAPALAR